MVGLVARALLALVAFGCAVPAYHYAEVAALRINAPLEAAKLAPHDVTALVNALGSQFDGNPAFKPSAKDIADIQTALVAQPLSPKLLGIMGLAYEANGDTRQAAEAMHVANRVSRRDVISQLYLIESASASGDVNETLRRYNAALLTHPDLNAALLPILSSAIAYPEIRTELRLYLQTGAKWVPAFLAVAAEKGRAADLQALLLPLPNALLNEEYAPILASVFHRVAVEGERSDALRLASSAIPGISFATLDDMSISPITLDKRLGLFAWTFPPHDGMQVEIGEDMSLRINANPLASGTIAVRDLLLEGGVKYKLVQRIEYTSGSPRIQARWSADCFTSDGLSQFWEQRLPKSSAEGTYLSEFTVPHRCKVVRMSLFAEGPDGQMPTTLKLSRLFMSRSQ